MTTNIQTFPGDVEVTSNLAVNTNDLFVDTVAGRVGLGTTSPSYKLDVASIGNPSTGTVNHQALRLHNDNYVGDDTIEMLFKHGYSGVGEASAKILSYLPGANDAGLKFLTTNDGTLSSTPVLTLTGDQTVGIGSVSPGARLDVLAPEGSGTQRTALKLTTSESTAGTGCNIDFYQSTALVGRIASVYEDPGAVGMALSTYNGSNSERVRISADGNVGIGTASPATYLHLSAKNSDPLDTEGDFVGTHTLTEYLRFTSRYDSADVNNVSVGFKLGADDNSGSNPNGRLDICANYGSTVDNGYGATPDKTIATFIGDGNVGIGTTNPNSLLTFYKDYTVPANGSEPAADTVQGITFRSDLSSSAASPAPNWSSTANPVDVAKIWFQPHSYLDISGSAGVHGYLALGTGYFGSQSSTPDMVIDTAGNVGIGTTNAQDLFHIYGASDSSLRVETDTGQAQLLLRSGNSTRRASRIDFARADTGVQYAWIIGDYEQDGTFDLTLGTDGGDRIMTLTQDGNVGIGTTSPARSLHVYRDKSYVSGGTHNNSAFEIKQQLGTDNYIYDGQHRAQFRINNGLGTYSNRSLELALLDNGMGVIQANAASEGYFPLSLNPGGNINAPVLVNSLTPSGHNFLVQGNAYVSSNLTVSGLLHVDAAATGRIGIGTTIPQEKLHIYDPDTNEAAIRLDNGTSQHRIRQKTGEATLQIESYPHASSGDYFRWITWNATDNGWDYRLNMNYEGTLYLNNDFHCAGRFVRNRDLRSISGGYTPAYIGGGRFVVGFDNLSGFGYCDTIGLNTYTDSSGGDTNNLVFSKNNISARMYQQTYASTSGFSTYKDFDMTTPSDDRLKDNEEYIRNATDTLLKLKPQVYDLKLTLSSNVYERAAGVMVQDVWYDAPELRFMVKPGYLSQIPKEAPRRSDDPRDDPDYSKWGEEHAKLEYNFFIPYIIKSIQEIHTELTKTKTQVHEITPSNLNDYRGMLVSADTNEFKNNTPKLSLTKKPYDKKCFGVVSCSNTHSIDNEILINTNGVGEVWVINHSNLESGDYLTSSNVPGYAMKQNDDILHNYTVAKSTMDCDFSPNQVVKKRVKQELANVTYYVKETLTEISKEKYDTIEDEYYKKSGERSLYIKYDYEKTDDTVDYDKLEYANSSGEVLSLDEWSVLESSLQSDYKPRYLKNKITRISIEEYSKLDDLKKSLYEMITEIVYYYKYSEKSKNPLPKYTIEEIEQEYVNILDENGQLQWEDTDEMEPAYKIRYLTADGQITDEANAVHVAAFVGCTYHCG